MKKILLRAEAVLVAVSVFFCSIIYKPVDVQAFTLVDLVIQIGLATLGYAVSDSIDWVKEKLGWSSADIQLDENGNVILSEAQMQELKDAINEYTQDSNGNDKYGMYVYEGTSGKSFLSFATENDWYDIKNHDLMLGITSGWATVGNNQGYCQASPAGAVWVGPKGGIITFYHSGTYSFTDAVTYYYARTTDGWQVKGPSSSPAYMSLGNPDSYYGEPHIAFTTISGYRQWKEDGNPYEKVTPTYTGGNLVIPKDQLQNPDSDPTVSGNDFDENGNPVTEKGWLQRIYERLGDILNQIKQIKWLTVVDVVINAIDAFGDDISNVALTIIDAVSQVFPLCILWDTVRIVEMFEAEPIPPVFEIPIKFESAGLDTSITIDLTEYEAFFAFIRTFEIVFFLLGLFHITMSWVGKGDDVI